MHPDQQATAMAGSPGPPIYLITQGTPAPQIEIADAEIGVFRDGQSVAQRREQRGFDIVENAGHGVYRRLDSVDHSRNRRVR